MSEISTSFCFICLLHLANEQGLKIEPARLDDGEEEYQGEMEPAVEATDGLRGWGAKVKGTQVDERADRTVGELQALKIWKVCDRWRRS
jgi:condensin complex subunit 2